MNRRKFLTASITSAVAYKYANAEKLLKKGGLIEQNSYSGNESLKFGGLSVEKILKDYHYYLFDDFLPFMDKYIIDHKYGGFMCASDRDGTNLSKDKYSWFEGRGTWVYSFLYRSFGKEEKYLEVARKSLSLILKTKPAGDKLWSSELSREGKALSPPAGRIYGDVFISEGMCEFARASGEMKYWDMSKEILLKCWKVYSEPDYYPNSVADYAGPEAIPFPGAKIQGVSMVMIQTISKMLDIKYDAELQGIISECLDAVINKHFNHEFDLNNELLNHDYSLPGNELAQFVYTGHSIETLWMIMKEAVRTKDVKLFQTAAERFKRHVEVAWDDVYGGVFRSLNNVDKDLWEVDRIPKVLWAQQEVLNGIMILIEQTDDEWAKKWFEKMYNYMVDKYLLKKYGYHLWMEDGDRKVTFKPHTNRIENYHLPRHLMLTYLALTTIKNNNGEPVWQAAVKRGYKDR